MNGLTATAPTEKPRSFFHRIEVGFKEGVKNPSADSLLHAAKNAGFKVKDIEIIEVYTISGVNGFWNLERLGKQVLADPLTQQFTINEPLARRRPRFDFAVEVSFRPGVTDNVGRTTTEAIKDITPAYAGTAFYSKQYLLSGSLSHGEVEKLFASLVANDLIERWFVKSFEEFVGTEGFHANPPIAGSEKNDFVEEIEFKGSAADLERLSEQRLLALSKEEMLFIKQRYSQRAFQQKRKKLGLNANATDVELEAIAQTWSEHCKHKIFNALIEYQNEDGKKEPINSLFKTFIKKSTDEIARQKPGLLLSVFKDNAGIFKFNKDWNIALKVETHNSPCALDPYGGAVTGIVGVNRDIMGAGLGARPIFNTDVFCFAPPGYSGVYPRIHPKRVIQGVVRGIQDGGNKSGIPTINGSITFDDSFAGKPLVYCGTCGIMPAKLKDGRRTHEKKAKSGSLIIMVGGRVGKDGIHGATFSSMGLTQDSPSSAVQIGDPYTQKKMLDFLMEARDEGLVESLTDNGAGGLSSSVGEMALQSGGAELHLDRVPLKYPGLAPWEIFLSESQERMTVAVKSNNKQRFLELARKHEVEATDIGTFTKSGFLQVLNQGKTIALLELEFIHHPPQLKLKAKARSRKTIEEKLSEPRNYESVLKKILASWNVCSKEEIVRRYDHEVQGMSAIKPFQGIANDGPSDAGVVKPLYNSSEGLVVSNGLCPKYSKFDAYNMAANALDEAIRNCVATGASLKEMYALDNFCWPDPIASAKNPDGEEKLGDLVQANKALYEYTKAYGVPCISGKDSMKNDAQVGPKKISVLPTLLFTAIAKIQDVSKSVSIDFKNEGDVIFVVGGTKHELGGSEYYTQMDRDGGVPPVVNAEENRKLYEALHKAIDKGLVASCHDVSDGGIATALAESSFAGGLGAELDLRKIVFTQGARRNDTLLFSESAGRFIVSVNAKKAKEFVLAMAGTKTAQAGVVKGKKLVLIGLDGKKIIDANTAGLKEEWKSRHWF